MTVHLVCLFLFWPQLSMATRILVCLHRSWCFRYNYCFKFFLSSYAFPSGLRKWKYKCTSHLWKLFFSTSQTCDSSSDFFFFLRKNSRVDVSRIKFNSRKNTKIKLIQGPKTFNIRMASLKGVDCQVHLLWQVWFVFNHCSTNEAFPGINISFVRTYRITWFILNNACFPSYFLKKGDISVLADIVT